MLESLGTCSRFLSRHDNFDARLKSTAFHNGSHGMVVRLDHAMETSRNMSNEEFVVQNIYHILYAYYKVSRKTFVDSVCKQAAMHCLLTCEESPLALFSPVFVSQLSVDVLEEIAAEASAMNICARG